MTDTVADAHANSLKYIFPAMGEVGVTDDVIKQLAVAGYQLSVTRTGPQY